MVQMFILFILYLFAGILESLPFRTLEFFGRLTEKLPILMVLGFGRDDAFRRDELSGLEIIRLESRCV